MHSISMNDQRSSNWTSHSIEPMGCGGPRFSLHVDATRQPDLSAGNDDVRESFAANLLRCQPRCIIITGQRDDLQEIEATVWDETICEGLTSPTVKSLSYTTVYCRPGYQDKRVLALLKKRETLPNITEFTIYDGLYGYADTFLQLYRLTNVETLVLKDSSYGVSLGRDACEALALAIGSLKNLQHIQLGSLCFACEDDWQLILNALTSHKALQSGTFFRLRMGDSKVDFSTQAEQHPVFVENKHVYAYLKEAFPGETSYSMTQMLEAYLHVRAELLLANAGTPATVAVVSDKPDLIFELFRNQLDSSMWLP